MKINQLFLFFCILFSTHIFGQNDVGFKASVISSFVSFKDVSGFHISMINQKNLIAPSGQIGFFYCHTFNKTTSFETDLLFDQVESRTAYIPNTMDWLGISSPTFTQVNSDYSEENRMHLSYLSIPVYYCYTLRQFKVSLGFQTSLKLGASNTIISHSSSGSTYTNDTRRLSNIDNLDYGPKIGLAWRLSTYLDLEGNWYYGLNNITHDPDFKNYMEYRIRQVSLGIRYILTRNK